MVRNLLFLVTTRTSYASVTTFLPPMRRFFMMAMIYAAPVLRGALMFALMLLIIRTLVLPSGKSLRKLSKRFSSETWMSDMIVNCYSLLDVKVGLFSMPWFFMHDAMAYRAVTELGADLSTSVGKYPSDYVLYRIGEFDDSNGVLAPVAPVNMGVVASLLVKG